MSDFLELHGGELTFEELYISIMDFPCGSAGEESTCNVGDLGSIPGLGRSAGEGNSYPLQYSGLENSMDHIVHGVAKSQTGLIFTITFIYSFYSIWAILFYF